MVAAVETSLRKLLEGTRQYHVPLYQRTYSWKQPQHERLWADIVKLAETRQEHPAHTHFLGSLVLAPSPTINPGKIEEYLVVDGQQRLTTLTILLAAIRDYRAETEDSSHIDRINEQYLTNKWEEGQPLKLLPTQKDRAAYDATVRSTPYDGPTEGITSAYRFFKAALRDTDDPDDELDIQRIEDAVLSGLALVSITAHQGDNVHRIFESLNNTGLKLTQGDLIRNYLFMRLPTRAQQTYDQYWTAIERDLDSKELELLFWLDLVQSDETAAQSDTYALQQSRMDSIVGEDAVVAEIARFAQLSKLLRLILDPSREPDRAVRSQLERLVAWGTTTVYPLVLNLLDRRERSQISSDDLAETLNVLVGYLVRRIVLGPSTANLNRTLIRSVQELPADESPAEALRRYLSVGRKYYASDAEIREAAPSVPFYWHGRAAQRKLVLKWLDEHLRRREVTDTTGLSVEHVMPQTPTEEWRSMLAESLGPDEDVDATYTALLHTIGNLTISAYNSELGNSPFEVKRERLANSGIQMNLSIAQNDSWGREQIEERSRQLAELIIDIWPGPVQIETAAEEPAVWLHLNRVLSTIPEGRWTTYGDVAATIGTHPVPLGQRLASHPSPYAYRVLKFDGAIATNFKWTDPDRTDDPMEVLKSEGVSFDNEGRADPRQRLEAAELALLAGLEIDGEVEDMLATASVEKEASFWAQVGEHQPDETAAALARLMTAWRHLGGDFLFGDAQETSCFVLCRPQERRPWPFTIYPSGRVEVVFQHMAHRPPFDAVELRSEFHARLSQVPGMTLDERLEARPGFDLELLTDSDAFDGVVEAMAWFIDQAI